MNLLKMVQFILNKLIHAIETCITCLEKILNFKVKMNKMKIKMKILKNVKVNLLIIDKK